MHPVDDVEEGEGEREEDPGEAVDLRGRVERPAGQHCRLLSLLPDLSSFIDSHCSPPECFIGQETVEKLAEE